MFETPIITSRWLPRIEKKATIKRTFPPGARKGKDKRRIKLYKLIIMTDPLFMAGNMLIMSENAVKELTKFGISLQDTADSVDALRYALKA